MEDVFKKLKCVYCNYEMASKAKKPKCGFCGSRKMLTIAEFSAAKPYRTKNEVEKMPKEKEQPAEEQQQQPKQKIKQQVKENDDIDDDILGDDDEEEE